MTFFADLPYIAHFFFCSGTCDALRSVFDIYFIDIPSVELIISKIVHVCKNVFEISLDPGR
jgi:hypothetical protein